MNQNQSHNPRVCGVLMSMTKLHGFANFIDLSEILMHTHFVSVGKQARFTILFVTKPSNLSVASGKSPC